MLKTTQRHKTNTHKTNTQRFKCYLCKSCETKQYSNLNGDESEYLSKLMATLVDINKKLHHNICISNLGKKVWPLNLALWLGYIYQCQDIKKLNKKVQVLQEQNNLQESQILELTHCLNLTMIQIHDHWGGLYEFDSKLIIIKKTMISTVKKLLSQIHVVSTY